MQREFYLGCVFLLDKSLLSVYTRGTKSVKDSEFGTIFFRIFVTAKSQLRHLIYIVADIIGL